MLEIIGRPSEEIIVMSLRGCLAALLALAMLTIADASGR